MEKLGPKDTSIKIQSNSRRIFVASSSRCLCFTRAEESMLNKLKEEKTKGIEDFNECLYLKRGTGGN